MQTNRTRLSSSLLNKVSSSNFFFLSKKLLSLYIGYIHIHSQPIYYFIGNAQTFINKYHYIYKSAHSKLLELDHVSIKYKTHNIMFCYSHNIMR